jgi:hypothetical protein
LPVAGSKPIGNRGRRHDRAARRGLDADNISVPSRRGKGRQASVLPRMPTLLAY